MVINPRASNARRTELRRYYYYINYGRSNRAVYRCNVTYLKRFLGRQISNTTITQAGYCHFCGNRIAGCSQFVPKLFTTRRIICVKVLRLYFAQSQIVRNWKFNLHQNQNRLF